MFGRPGGQASRVGLKRTFRSRAQGPEDGPSGEQVHFLRAWQGGRREEGLGSVRDPASGCRESSHAGGRPWALLPLAHLRAPRQGLPLVGRASWDPSLPLDQDSCLLLL